MADPTSWTANANLTFVGTTQVYKSTGSGAWDNGYTKNLDDPLTAPGSFLSGVAHTDSGDYCALILDTGTGVDTTGNTGPSYMLIHENGRVLILEDGTLVLASTTVAAGSVLKVRRGVSHIEYLENEKVLYTSTKSIEATLYPELGFYGNGASAGWINLAIDKDSAIAPAATDCGSYYGQHGSTWKPPSVTGPDGNYILGAGHNGSVYFIYNLFLRFDTSTIPDADTVLSARLQVKVSSVSVLNWGGLVFDFDWKAFSGAPGSGDWSNTFAGNAFTGGSPYGTTTKSYVFELTNAAANVNKSGYTGLRCGTNYSTSPAGGTYCLIGIDDEASANPPLLFVTHMTPAGIVKTSMFFAM